MASVRNGRMNCRTHGKTSTRWKTGNGECAPLKMNITLHIPDSIARSLRIPEGEAEQRLRQELSVALYARDLLSFGKASALAGTNRFLFADILTQRDIARHYGKEELSEDLTYADGE